jgi:DNA-binding IclR family transcriptional regulator
MSKSATEVADSGQHQNIARASLVIDILAASGAQGLRLAEVTKRSGLSKTATHRCLAGLTAHRLATFDDATSLFFLGDQIFEWYIAARERYALAERVLPYINRLADETEDTVYFMVRRGSDAVCYARGEGRFPIKTLTLDVGQARPLGTNTGSLAILAFLEDREIAGILNSKTYAEKSAFSAAGVRKLIGTARHYGYSWIDGHIMEGMSGIGVPVRDSFGLPVAALSIAAISQRLIKARRAKVLDTLKREAALIEKELRPLLK